MLALLVGKVFHTPTALPALLQNFVGDFLNAENKARVKGKRDNLLRDLEWRRDHHLHKVKFDIIYMAPPPCSQQRKNKTANVRAWASSTSMTLNAISCATDLGINLLNGKPQNRSSTQTNAALQHISVGISQVPQVIKHM